MRSKPTRRQRECLTLMVGHFLTFGEWPTIDELAAALGIYPSAVGSHLRALQRKGHAVRVGGAAASRAWRPSQWAAYLRPAARALLTQVEKISCLK
jgi:predicted ArsR family transcriptional regulator